jgi:anion-transporting  ArsA/GET3 family ATPase
MNPKPFHAQSANPFDCELHLVTGKGGVGRTTFALSLAVAFAKQKQKTLLLELADQDEHAQSMIGRWIDEPFLRQIKTAKHEKIGYQGDDLSFGQLIAKTGHEGFLKAVLPISTLAQAALQSKPLSRFLESAPSLYELGLFYHLWMIVQTQKFQKIVIDLPATGHTLALTRLPAQLSRLIKKGPLVTALEQGKNFLSHPQKTSIWIVALAERLPISEALDLKVALMTDGFQVSGLILNQVPIESYQSPLSESVLNALSKIDLSGLGIGEIERMIGWQDLLKTLKSNGRIFVLPQAHVLQRHLYVEAMIQSIGNQA